MGKYSDALFNIKQNVLSNIENYFKDKNEEIVGVYKIWWEDKENKPILSVKHIWMHVSVIQTNIRDLPMETLCTIADEIDKKIGI